MTDPGPQQVTVDAPEGETALERAYRLGEGCGGLDAAGVQRLVQMSMENETLAPGEVWQS